MIELVASLGEQDAAARERALDPTRSILLEAPAGSGKTTVLTGRFLRLLCVVEEPEQILAITFTRKAAGEMRERVLRALRGESAALSAGPMRELAAAALARSRERGWSLETDPGRLRIQTIDALNRYLASQLPLSARGAGDARVLESPEMLYRRAARRALIDAQRDEHLAADAERLFERLDNDFGRFERLLTEMLRGRGHWLPVLLGAGSGAVPPIPLHERGSELPARVEESLRALIEERLRGATAAIRGPLIAEGGELAARAARVRAQTEPQSAAGRQSWRAWLEPPGDGQSLSLGHWRGLAQLALTAQGEWRRSLSRRDGFPADDESLKALKSRALEWIGSLARLGVREQLCELAALPDAALPAEDAGALTSLARVLQLAASELAVVFAESRRVDFVEVAAAARQALMEEGAPSDLALELGAEVRHILVDEFQDTSIEQVRLLEALTAGWEDGDGRTLFVVGDPMQSIYQFREAEVGLFLRAATHGVGKLSLERLELARNFRAGPALVAWLNEVFPQCFPAHDDPRSSAVRYRPSESGRTGGARTNGPVDAGEAVHLHATPPGDCAAEAQAIVGLIRQVRMREPAASIAVLVAARAHAAPISGALDQAGISFAGVDLVPLGELPIVRDLEALARALDHFADRTAWLAVLRAPWCGLTLIDLSALLEGAAERTVWEMINDERRVAVLPREARVRLERTRQVLTHALGRRDRLDFASWVENAWLALGGPAACRDEVDLERARAFFARLGEWSSEPTWTGPLELAERLETLFAAADARVSDAVQIMTIHRAKGLEFDTVIVPALARKLRASTEPLLRWLELPRDAEGTDLLMAAIPPPWRRGEDRLGEYLKDLTAQRTRNERIRLLYVAATRARSELHLFAEPPQSTVAGGAAVPAGGTLLAALWSGIADRFAAVAASAGADALGATLAATVTPEPRTATPSTVRASLLRLAADWQMPPLPEMLRSRDLTADPEEPLLESEETRQSVALPLASARIVADQLRRSARIGVLPPAGSPALVRALRERLRRLGFEGLELEEATGQAIAMFEGCLKDPKLQWVFSRAHAHSESPCRLSGVVEGRLTSVTLDRTFIDAAGLRWAIRFVPHRASDAEHEWSERAASLARALGPEPVRAALYDAARQDWRELAAAPRGDNACRTGE